MANPLDGTISVRDPFSKLLCFSIESRVVAPEKSIAFILIEVSNRPRVSPRNPPTRSPLAFDSLMRTIRVSGLSVLVMTRLYVPLPETPLFPTKV